MEHKKIKEVTLEMIDELLDMDTELYEKAKTTLLNGQYKTNITRNYLRTLFAFTDQCRTPERKGE